MIINVYDNYNKKINFDYERIIKDFEGMNNEVFISEKEISLILVNLDGITQINSDYRHKEGPTDVISFEANNEDDEIVDDYNYAGDIFLCIDKVYEQALNYGHSYEREFAFLLCHGILHLHGYDHMVKEDEVEMFKKQEEILDILNYRR